MRRGDRFAEFPERKMKMHTTFSKAVDTFVVASNKGTNAFGTLADYCHASTKSNIEARMDPNEVGSILKNNLKAQEQEYKAAHPKCDEFPVAYRTAKSVLLKAVSMGIALVDAKGKLKGKSALEAEIKAGKDEKSELEKFQNAVETAGKIFAKIDTVADIRQAKAITALLVDAILKAERASVAVVVPSEQIAA